jgi:hypothetical protein
MQKLKFHYNQNEGKILLFITAFASCGLIILISEFTNIINFII